MENKLGRNDPYWCGSGVKYKKCHLNREAAEPAKVWEVASEQKRLRSRQYCLHPAADQKICEGGIIKAHTVQKSGMLNRIARNGHVYQSSDNFFDLVKSGGEIIHKLMGINDASTFTGFCSFHDNKTFEPIEKQFFVGTRDQCFLLAYRAICREVFVKRSQMDSIPFTKTLDRGKHVHQQAAIQMKLHGYEAGVQAGLSDLEQHKATYDKGLLSESYDDTCYYILWLKDAPDIMCSSLLYPACDFVGKSIQDLADFNKKLALITYSLIATETGGAIVFVWNRDSNAACMQLVSTLDSMVNDLIPHAIVRFLFEFCENKFMSPDWWENLSEDNRKKLEERYLLATSPVSLRSSKCLLDDGVRAVSWEITSKQSNVL